MHLERQGLYLHGPSFRAVHSPSSFSGANQLPLKLYRAQGIHCLGYLDDLLVFASSKAQCQKDLLCLKEHLEKLGFIVNLEKSQLFPS